jgi:multidrug resistance efflux pump
MREEDESINLHSEEVNEILSNTPNWIFRWGISVISMLLVIAIGLSYFIRYPDILTADITLTTLNPPISLVSKNTGKITYLLVKNNEVVKTGNIIAVIENSADFKDVQYLGECCSGYISKLKLCDTLPDIVLRENLKVGELTPGYLLVLKALKDLNLYKEMNAYKKQISLLKKDLLGYNDLMEKYKRQLNINTEELSLFEKDYNRDTQLFKEGVIPARESETKKKEYLRALNAHEQVKIAVSNAYIQINSIEKNILQQQIQDFEEQTKLKNEIQQKIKTVLSEIIKWKQLFLIESPIDGKISFFNFWAVNQNVKTGDELFSIVPNQKQYFIGKCILPITNTGKLAIGQKVNIKLDNYPYNESGILQGVVTNISIVPDKDNYAVDVDLRNGLVTSYNKVLTYKEQMKGKADIITKNLSVMDRVFFNFKKLIER